MSREDVGYNVAVWGSRAGILAELYAGYRATVFEYAHQDQVANFVEDSAGLRLPQEIPAWRVGEALGAGALTYCVLNFIISLAFYKLGNIIAGKDLNRVTIQEYKARY